MNRLNVFSIFLWNTATCSVRPRSTIFCTRIHQRYLRTCHVTRSLSDSKKKSPIFQVPLTTSKETTKKRVNAHSASEDSFMPISAFGVAQQIDLSVAEAFMEENFQAHAIQLPNDLNEHTRLLSLSKEGDRTLFVFRNGCLVFWNCENDQCMPIVKALKKACRIPLPDRLIETEELRFRYSELVTSHNVYSNIFESVPTYLRNDDVYLQVRDYSMREAAKFLDEYALSDALASSVKLNILENSFDAIAVKMEPWIDCMRNGLPVSFSQNTVLEKTGELFTIRHLLNVSTYLTETPDVYWERPAMELLFNQLRTVLSIPARARILNSKLDMCCELTEILSTHLSARHSSRLEWMIILLITVEVVFELVNFYEKKQDKVK